MELTKTRRYQQPVALFELETNKKQYLHKLILESIDYDKTVCFPPRPETEQTYYH